MGLLTDRHRHRVALLYIVLDDQAHRAPARLYRDVPRLFRLHQGFGIGRGVLLGQRADRLPVLLVFLGLLLDDVFFHTALASAAGAGLLVVEQGLLLLAVHHLDLVDLGVLD